jgi:hypothetical protein
MDMDDTGIFLLCLIATGEMELGLVIARGEQARPTTPTAIPLGKLWCSSAGLQASPVWLLSGALWEMPAGLPIT